MPQPHSNSPRRGEVWLVDFDPQIGDEIMKRRPAVVVGSDEIGVLPLRIVAPVTGWKERYSASPWLVRLSPSKTNGLDKESVADGFQVKSLSVLRFKRMLGVVPRATCEEIAAAIALCVGFSPPPSGGDSPVNPQ